MYQWDLWVEWGEEQIHKFANIYVKIVIGMALTVKILEDMYHKTTWHYIPEHADWSLFVLCNLYLQAMVLSQQMLQEKYAENQRVRGVLCEVGDPELDRYLEDERIALFLQNEEFMAELRWNKDFLSTLEKGAALLNVLYDYH